MSDMPRVASALNHVAYLTCDTGATYRFYTEVLGFPLVGAVSGSYDPESDIERPHLHTFFDMGKGKAIAFFEIDGVEHPPKGDVPTWARHFAMGVDSHEELQAWRQRLKDHGVPVTDVVDHDSVWYSIYFQDPNNVLLEFTYQARELTAKDAEKAHDMVTEWTSSHGQKMTTNS
jgi:catechol 2,3-dioxygenase-like lactoylglutathione lyase family enzyme